MDISISTVVRKMESQVVSLKNILESSPVNEARVREHAAMLKAYCELLLEKESVSKPVPQQVNRSVPVHTNQVKIQQESHSDNLLEF